MLQSLEKKVSGLSELDPLQQKLLQRLSGKERFLLVLDDVWEAENLNIHSWNLLMAPFRNRTADTKIIMTTRSRKISEMVPRTLTYDLGFLSDEDTLELFMLHAFEGRDPSLYQNLAAVGKETARKCRGVPLAAKTIGGLLHTKEDKEWNEILKSEVWDATINQEDSIIPILRLSYWHLPVPIKRCFRYCSLFAKGYVFDRNHIIRMWMAQGYIKANRRELMEDIGQRYIDNLLSRSFFQKCPWNPEGLQMHDLMHDLARCVSGGECYSMEGGKSCLIPSNVRHLAIFPTADPRRTVISSTKDISEPKSFRSFLLPDEKLCHLISHDELLSDLYTRMEHLRVLDLGGVRLCGVPESIAHLKHLRYLRISGFFKELPEFVGNICHLQTLDLGGVTELPNSMSNLLNLRHLRGRDIIEYSVGIGKLADLRTMPGFQVSPKHNHAKLGELKDMNNIRGVFAISGLENLADVSEAKKACLDKKRNISFLHLEWDPRAASSSIDEEVLESLKPSVKLVGLQISGFKGPSYPSWLVDQSFFRLGTIELELCEKWISLPPLGQLPSLKLLYISNARAVEYIGREFFSGGFPRLEELTLGSLNNWKSWCGAQERDCPKLKKLSIERCGNLESFSLINLGALEDMSISRCPKLRCVPGQSLELSHLPCVQTIKIQDIYKVRLIDASFFSPAAPLGNQPCLELEDVGQREVEYILDMCSRICRLTVRRCLNLTSLPLGNLSAMEYLAITECPELQITSISPQLWQLPSPQRIDVNGIHGAESIKVVWESHMELTHVNQPVASSLKEFSLMIRQLVITNCANLTSLPLMDHTALEYLEISGCNQLQLSSGSFHLPQSMCEMKVKYIRGAEYIHGLFSPGGVEALGTSCLEFKNVDQSEASFLLHEYSHMIRRLIVTECANLTSLPWADLTALEYLRISECPLFQLLDAEQLPPTLQVLCIYGNPYERVQCIRHQHFQRLKLVLQCSNKEGGDCNLYLVFRNVHDASEAASNFCHDASEAASNSRPKVYREVRIWEIEWDCCTNDRSNFVDSVAEEVLGKLYHSLAALWNIMNANKLVIRGHKGSRFASLRWHPFFYLLSSVSLIQCTKYEILPPLSQLNFLKELFVEGASSLESFMQNGDDIPEDGWQETQARIAFPRLQKLEFHNMPVWKEWLGTKEGDFPLLRKLILKHCPRLMALPHLPPSLEELELEACHELTSLFDSPYHTKSFISFNPLRWLSLSATEGTPPILQHMSLTNSPLLLTWCEGHSRILADIPNLLIDGVQVHTRDEKGIRQ